MKIKWKCLLGAFFGALVIMAALTAVGYGGFWMWANEIPPLPVCLMAGVAVVAVVAVPTAALYDLCKDKWH